MSVEDAIGALESLASDAETIADAADRVTTNAAQMVIDAGSLGDVQALADNAERIASHAAHIAADAGTLAAQLVDVAAGLSADAEDLFYREDLPEILGYMLTR